MHFGLRIFSYTRGKNKAGILISIGIAIILGFVSGYGATLIESREKSNVKLSIVNETKTLIKGKIDGIEDLNKEDISTLVAMITTL